MKKIFFIWLLLGFKIAYPFTISNIIINGITVSRKETILSFFYEYTYQGKRNFSEKELIEITRNTKRRLERSGWYRDVEVTFYTNTNNMDFVDIRITLSEKTPYTIYLKNDFIGIGKYNLWGKGKEAILELGLSHKGIKLSDRMYEFTPFFYEVYVGSQSYSYSIIQNESYEEIPLLRQMGYLTGGYSFTGDDNFHIKINAEWLQETNYNPICNLYYIEGGYKIDKRTGYPMVISGYYLELNSRIYSINWVPYLEIDLRFYIPLFQSLIWANRFHFLSFFGELPIYYRIDLRDINSLHTLSSSPNLIGNKSYDIHTELRWSFWDKFVFLLFDVQMEALLFGELGECVNEFSEFSKPHYVYGSGLRIYLDSFAIRTEIGINEINEVAVFSSFDLPF